MSVLKIAALTYLVFVLQTAVAPELAIGGAAPQLTLLALTWLALRCGGREGLLWAAVWGLLADALSTGPLGLHLIGFTVLAWLLQSVRQRGPIDSAWQFAVIVGGGVLGVGAMEIIVAQGGTGLHDISAAVWQRLVVSGMYTAVLAGGLSFGENWFRGPIREEHSGSPRVSNRWRMLTN